MSDQKRSIQEIMDELNRINQEYRQKLSAGMNDPDSFMKLAEIERLGRELSKTTQNLYLEQTVSVLDSVDETILIRKKKENTKKKESN